MSRSNIWISPNSSGWKVQRESSIRASRNFATQKQAENFGRNLLENGKGGELITQNKHGQIRSKDTINSSDPSYIRDTEH